MALKDGSVNDLVRDRSEDVAMGGVDIGDVDSVDKKQIAEGVLQQILGAIDYLACYGILHRDIKPANILYTSRPGGGFS
jgi:serine/threonine protein kinase